MLFCGCLIVVCLLFAFKCMLFVFVGYGFLFGCCLLLCCFGVEWVGVAWVVVFCVFGEFCCWLLFCCFMLDSVLVLVVLHCVCYLWVLFGWVGCCFGVGVWWVCWFVFILVMFCGFFGVLVFGLVVCLLCLVWFGCGLIVLGLGVGGGFIVVLFCC